MKEERKEDRDGGKKTPEMIRRGGLLIAEEYNWWEELQTEAMEQ